MTAVYEVCASSDDIVERMLAPQLGRRT